MSSILAQIPILPIVSFIFPMVFPMVFAGPPEAELPDVSLCPAALQAQLLGDAVGGAWRREPMPGQRLRLQRLDAEGRNPWKTAGKTWGKA